MFIAFLLIVTLNNLCLGKAEREARREYPKAHLMCVCIHPAEGFILSRVDSPHISSFFLPSLVQTFLYLWNIPDIVTILHYATKYGNGCEVVVLF